MRLLVVDYVVDYLVDKLKRFEPAEASARVALTGVEAFTLARDYRPDVLLIGADLPDVDG